MNQRDTSLAQLSMSDKVPKSVGLSDTYSCGDAENARPENDGQRKLWVWKMQDWKMTDKNYGVWKMTDNIFSKL